MRATFFALLSALPFALGTPSAMAVDFHGYMRAGLGANLEGGSQYCYGTGGPAWHLVGRLGDECDTYAELTLSQSVFDKDGHRFTVHTLMAYGTAEGFIDARGNSWQGLSLTTTHPWEGQRFSFREAYVDYSVGGKYTLWAGNRYYGRKDIHMLDLYYLNNSGYGAGIEGVSLGDSLKLSAAYVQHRWKLPVDGLATPIEASGAFSTAHTLDLRLGVKLADPQSLELILLAARPSYSDAVQTAIDNEVGNYTDYGLGKGGFSATLEYGYKSNKVALQLSSEGYAWAGFAGNHLGDSYNMEIAQDGRSAARLMDYGTLGKGDLDLGYVVILAALNKGDDTEAAVYGNAVLRPMYHWNDHTSTVLELGAYAQDYGESWGGGTWSTLQKVTLAQQVMPSRGFWARPSLRVFASLYGGDLAVDQYRYMVGAQMEAWW